MNDILNSIQFNKKAFKGFEDKRRGYKRSSQGLFGSHIKSLEENLLHNIFKESKTQRKVIGRQQKDLINPFKIIPQTNTKDLFKAFVCVALANRKPINKDKESIKSVRDRLSIKSATRLRKGISHKSLDVNKNIQCNIDRRKYKKFDIKKMNISYDSAIRHSLVEKLTNKDEKRLTGEFNRHKSSLAVLRSDYKAEELKRIQNLRQKNMLNVYKNCLSKLDSESSQVFQCYFGKQMNATRNQEIPPDQLFTRHTYHTKIFPKNTSRIFIHNKH